MKFFAPALLLAAGVSAVTTTAAGSSATGSTCDGAPVLEQCLITTKAAKDLCKPQDYNCLCTAMRAVFGCFNSAGCPDDARAPPAKTEMQTFCAYETTTTAFSAVETSTTTGGSQATAATTTGSSSSSTDTPDSPNSGAYFAMNAGGMIVAVAGVVAAVL